MVEFQSAYVAGNSNLRVALCPPLREAAADTGLIY